VGWVRYWTGLLDSPPTKCLGLQASCIFGGRGERERRKYVGTLWIVSCTRHRNVGGSNLIGPFISRMWLLHSSCIRSVYLFVYDVATLASSISSMYTTSLGFAASLVTQDKGNWVWLSLLVPTDTAPGYTCKTIPAKSIYMHEFVVKLYS